MAGFTYTYGIKVKTEQLIFDKKNISEGGARFKAVAQEIAVDGREGNRQELESDWEGLIKYKKETDFDYVRFNLYFL